MKRRLDDQKYVEQSRQITEGVKDAVRAGAFSLSLPFLLSLSCEQQS